MKLPLFQRRFGGTTFEQSLALSGVPALLMTAILIGTLLSVGIHSGIAVVLSASGIAGAAFLLTFLLQRRTLQRKLAPLRAVETAIARLEQGDLRARVPIAFADDPRMLRLVASVNRLFDRTSTDRQRLREVAARAFRAQEAERLRIARELQEETAQTLTTVLFQLRAARQTEEATARDALLDQARDGLMHTTDSLRRYARVLHPPSLSELGLLAALEGYARTLMTGSGLEIQILADHIQGVLPPEGELALYRIVQEALGNVVRHAGATQALVRIRHTGDSVRTLVQDNGRGFAVEETGARLPCLGLFGMRERALSVGGAVEIDSIPGDGTQVRIAIPVAAHPAAAPPAPWPVIVQRSDRQGPAPERLAHSRGEPALQQSL
jgi:two-component system, NarL family, sensor histidine kinase UhpB